MKKKQVLSGQVKQNHSNHYLTPIYPPHRKLQEAFCEFFSDFLEG